MRNLVILLLAIMSAGCSALMVGGGTSGNNPYTRDESSATRTAADATLSTTVRNKLVSDTGIGSDDLDVSAMNGKVTLSGTVDSYAARERAEKLAIDTNGVVAVDNRIQVEHAN